MAASERNQNYHWKQSSFAGGLFGRHLLGRDDLSQYSIGAQEMTNFFPYSYGGFSRRPGTRFVNACKYKDKKVRLVPFTYSDDISFILEFGDKYIRFYRDGGIVLNEDTPVEVTTEYSESELFSLKIIQSADRMYICHPNHPVMTLSRYSDTDWRLETYQNKRGPFREQNTEDITITPSAASGDYVTLTSSSDVFTKNMVGSLIRISYNVVGQSVTLGLRPSGTTEPIMCNGNWDLRLVDPASGVLKIQQSNDNKKTWEDVKEYSLQSSTTANFADSGETNHFCYLRLTFQHSDENGRCTLHTDPFVADGFATITEYVNSKNVKCKIFTDANNYEWGLAYTTPTRYWSLGAWSKENGYPHTASFYQDRLFFGATKADPLTIWGSQSGNYDDFFSHTTPEDSDSVSFSLTSNQVNRPISFISLSSLLAFTSSSEWVIRSGASNAAITPTSISAVQQSSEGISDVDPILINDRVLFITRTGNYVRDISYDYSTDSYRGNDLTLFNRDIFDGHSIVSWCAQISPDNIIWACRDDGKLLSFTYIWNQEVRAWAVHETKGKFESCASIPDKDQDEVYFVVNRTINGETVRYIEMLAHKSIDMNTMEYMDSCLSYHGDSVNTFSGLDHLEGETVQVLANGSYIGDFTVTDGAITINYEASDVVVGLPYESKFETLDIPVPRSDGTSFARQKKVSRVTIKLKDTYGGEVSVNNGESGQFANMAKIDMRRPEYIGGPALMYNEDYKTEPMAGYGDEAHIDVRQNQPYPITVLSIVAEVAMG